jgi:hypothetical protein
VGVDTARCSSSVDDGGDSGCVIERSSSGPTSIDAVAIVTGGSSEAGRELEGTRARRGFSVVVAYRATRVRPTPSWTRQSSAPAALPRDGFTPAVGS